MLIISKGGFQFMKKFKLVKTAAALALGASVVTAAVVPGATDASAASKYKVSNGKLLNAKTGKAVKGYVVYKSKLYYNGKVKKGYKTVGTGKSIKLYYNGTLKKGYKTARDNKLLFFNGKLKKGYKTALSGEYLYKNGFLNKGYKVYGDVDKSPVLYYNGKLKSGYKTANNGTLLFYNGKLKAGYKTAKGGTVLYKEGRLTKGLVEFDGKFYNDSKLANGEVDGTFYKDGKAVVALEGVKAINNTTVEVTFKEAQKYENIKASRFAIEGLEVKNAAVKQTNDKVVVLTTSAQEAGKTYTLSVDGVKAKSFTAVSSVVPTAVELSTPSIQGVLGKEVTVTSKVTVPDGQSKAGIAVTFNIAAAGTFNEGKKIEALTDENGVAKISYTQYHPGEDTVYAYPTGAANVKTTVGKVYWGNAERLTVIDVTAGTTLANESKKVYKVTSPENKNGYVNVAFKENVDVTPDKLVRTVKVVDASGDAYPYQVTTGGVQYVQVKLDSKGEATFTLQGSNATVTPIVFADGSSDDYKTAAKNNKLEPTELQAQASSVTFDKIFSQGLKVEAVGTQNAAFDKSATASDAKDVNSGGREYTVTVTDKDGKLAPAGTKAYVTFKKGDVSAYGDVRVNGQTVTSATDEVLITVGKDGKATFKLTGAKDAYAAPTVFIENGTASVELDDADLSTTAEKTFFLAPTVKEATLEASKETQSAANPVTFTYQSVDQNGFPYASDYNNGKYSVSFEVSATFADVTVTGLGTVKAGTTKTFTVPANSNGEATIDVQPVDGLAANVTVNASASQASLPNKTASVAFTKASVVPATYTGTVESIDKAKNKIKFNAYADAVTYSTATFKNEKGVVLDEAAFEKYVDDAINAGDIVTVTAVKGSDGTYALEIEKIVTPTTPIPGTGTISSVVANADGTKLTVTFDKDLKSSSVTLADFTIVGATTVSIDSISGNTVVINVTGATTASTVAVAADLIEFTDGTSNGAIAAVTATQPVVNKISSLRVNDENIATAIQKDATGSLTVGSKTINADVKHAEAKQAAYNGLKVTFVQDGTTAVDPVASYNGTAREITVKLGLDDSKNTLAKINAAIAAATPATHGDVTIANVELSAGSDVPTFAEVATPVTVALAGGVTGATAQVGEYEFTLTNNLAKGDVITLNGKTYVAGTDFIVGSNVAKTADNLADAITNAINDGKETRFATAVDDGSGVITLTDAKANGAAAPTLSIK